MSHIIEITIKSDLMEDRNSDNKSNVNLQNVTLNSHSHYSFKMEMTHHWGKKPYPYLINQTTFTNTISKTKRHQDATGLAICVLLREMKC